MDDRSAICWQVNIRLVVAGELARWSDRLPAFSSYLSLDGEPGLLVVFPVSLVFERLQQISPEDERAVLSDASACFRCSNFLSWFMEQFPIRTVAQSPSP